MSKRVEEVLDKIPILKYIVRFLKSIKLPGLEGLSIYDLLELYTVGIVEGTLTTRASAIAFNFFTAIFPFLLFVIIIIPNITIPGFQEDFLSFLDSILPPQTSEFFNQNIFENINKNRGAGLVSSVFVLSLFLMANGVNSVFTSFETSYHDVLTRNLFRQYLYALGVSLILVLLLILTVAVSGYVQIYILAPIYDAAFDEDINQSGLGWIQALKYLFYVIMVYIATATLYYFGTREGKHTRFFSVGALLTTILIIITSYFFGVYIESFSKYNELYGSIGALLILLLYLWLNSNILLLGYELNVTLRVLHQQHQNSNE
ncbi:YihY/virulence factor BrkB family protein [Winogradskyella aurantiaca]|uniref:YihY/virulence factor BrkB family protein n=1 Tax=Winogradskyella aurantiaca TaxID=2219558 RepID=UPI000E1DC3B0|nr:YihY/virulence factor BrkB family protein [Winogradskyella aurantiaca]